MEQELPFQELAYYERAKHHLLDDSGIDGNREDSLKPSRSVVERILSYSKALKVQKSNLIGSVEFLTN